MTTRLPMPIHSITYAGARLDSCVQVPEGVLCIVCVTSMLPLVASRMLPLTASATRACHNRQSIAAANQQIALDFARCGSGQASKSPTRLHVLEI
jgi:hypothetical protein